MRIEYDILQEDPYRASGHADGIPFMLVERRPFEEVVVTVDGHQSILPTAIALDAADIPRVVHIGVNRARLQAARERADAVQAAE